MHPRGCYADVMAGRFQIPLYKLLLAVAVYGLAFRILAGYALSVQAAVGGFLGTIVSLYILFFQETYWAVGLGILAGAIIGFFPPMILLRDSIEC